MNPRRFTLSTLLGFFCLAALLTAQQAPTMPMQARYEDGAEFRWLNKKVLDSRVLDSMEDTSSWSFAGAGEMALTEERAKDGRHALRIRSTSNIAEVGNEGEWEDLVATRKFAGEDWSRYNRISLWVYPDVVGAPAISCSLILHNDGKHKLPDSYNEGRHESIILRNHMWNQVVWEIAPLDYDWTPLYSVRSGQMVGALPVGIETKGFDDAPYWPTQICWTYKEVWTQPVGHWIWLMQDVAVPAIVRVAAAAASHEPVDFREQRTGQVTTATSDPSDGEIRIRLPEGHYSVSQGSAHTSLTVLPGGQYHLDLRREHALDFKVTFQDLGRHEIVLRVSAEGAGSHAFAVRSDNLILREPVSQKIDLTFGNPKEILWHARVVSAETPWVALVIPDGVASERREVTAAELPHK